MRNYTPASVLLGLILTLSSTTVPAAFDGSKNLVCAAGEVVACTDGPTCMQGRARDFELPSFMVVDFQKNVVRATDDSGHKQVSPIKNVENTDMRIILQGVENHRGWTVAIDRKLGDIVVSTSGPDVSFIIFGACTAL